MISVQNLLQRLSGNKRLLDKVSYFILISTILTLSACGATKKANTGNSKTGDTLDPIEGTRYNPQTGKHEPVVDGKQPVDTVRWSQNPNTKPPIQSDPSKYGQGKNDNPGDVVVDPSDPTPEISYKNKMAIMLPFLSDRFSSSSSSLSEKSRRAVEFYAGAKVAFDELNNEGINLQVAVYDTKGSEAETTALLQRQGIREASMIIGPVKRANLKKVAAYAKQNKKILVSPISPSSSIGVDNPYYVQVSPSLQTHCEAITNHVRKNYSADQVVLVCRDKSQEKARLKYFQDANAAYEGSSFAPKLKEYIVTDPTTDFNEMDPMPYILEDKTTVFVVPSFSNEKFIYSLLRKLSIAKGNRKVVVYGFPQWMRYELISPDYLERLNVHISSSSHVDPDSYEVKQFKEKYFYRYGTVASMNAFIGYETTLYFAKMLHKHGKIANSVIDREPAELMHSKFIFEPINANSGNIENFTDIKQYENKHVNILEFKDFHYQLAN